MHNPFRYVVIMRENSLRVAEVEVVAEAAMEYKSEEFSKIYLTMDQKIYPWKNITVTNPPMANCLELHAAGYRQDGVYWIDPTGQRVLIISQNKKTYISCVRRTREAVDVVDIVDVVDANGCALVI